MPKIISGKELVKFLFSKGFTVYSRRGSHLKLLSAARHCKTIIPLHKEISVGTMHAIFKQARLSDEEIKELLES